MITPLFCSTSPSSFRAAAAARRGRPSTAPVSSPKRITNTGFTRATRLPTHPKHKFPPTQQPPQTQPQQQPKQEQEEEQFLQQQKHRDRAVESFHGKQRLNALINKLLSKHGSDPIRILFTSEDGDLNKEEFWAVVRFLAHHSRLRDVISVFDFWKNTEKSRINEANYANVIELLSKSAMMEEVISMVQEMKAHGLTPTVPIYNAIIHGFASKGEFDTARKFLTEMLEIDLKPETETYNGLIQAYGNHQMYDEMGKCVKKMEMVSCFPNEGTYNILIRAFAKGGLLEKMEIVHRTVISKKMTLESLTLIAMLEAYADYGICEKMEMVYHRVLSSKILLEENLIRKMARVYMEGYRFSRLEELAHDTASNSGRTQLVWYLLLLSSACLMSQRGMESIICEIVLAEVRPDVTFINIIALSYFRMKNFRNVDAVLSQLQMQKLKPDIVSLGIAFDANREIDFEIKALEVWIRTGCLAEEVEMRTDPLVLSAFGKGSNYSHFGYGIPHVLSCTLLMVAPTMASKPL
ncbi:hypothetical protein ACLOJK_022730 [Asimina triloba]